MLYNILRVCAHARGKDFLKKVCKMFGGFKISLYLCIVKRLKPIQL